MCLTIDEAISKFQDSVYRASFSICRNQQDAEDITQETFIRYMRQRGKEFESDEHVRAWLLRTAINLSKNLVHSFWRRNRSTLEEELAQVPVAEPKDRDLLESVLELPEKYRIVIHLYYYEDYSVSEISQLLRISESSVKNRLLRGRRMLRFQIEEDEQ